MGVYWGEGGKAGMQSLAVPGYYFTVFLCHVYWWAQHVRFLGYHPLCMTKPAKSAIPVQLCTVIILC